MTESIFRAFGWGEYFDFRCFWHCFLFLWFLSFCIIILVLCHIYVSSFCLHSVTGSLPSTGFGLRNPFCSFSDQDQAVSWTGIFSYISAFSIDSGDMRSAVYQDRSLRVHLFDQRSRSSCLEISSHALQQSKQHRIKVCVAEHVWGRNRG